MLASWQRRQNITFRRSIREYVPTRRAGSCGVAIIKGRRPSAGSRLLTQEGRGFVCVLAGTARGGDCSCLSFIRSKPVANGVRLCWFFVPDHLSAFASKKPND